MKLLWIYFLQETLNFWFCVRYFSCQIFVREFYTPPILSWVQRSPLLCFFNFFRRLCRLSIQTIRFSWFVSYLSFTAIHFQDSGDRKKKGKSMAFSKESFNISQYKTGWFCGRKESSWENIMLNTLYSLFIQIKLMCEWGNYN